jgi:carbamoyltransferase
LLYSGFTYYCGFKVNSGEYKLMGLAPYGSPKYVDLIKQHLITIEEDGSFELNMSYFSYEKELKMINENFCSLFGQPVRKEETTISQFYKDIASSIQKVTEDIVLLMVKHVKKETGMENLCLAGGVALNCVSNGNIQKRNTFKNIWIQPAAGDSGNAIGAALLVWHQNLNNKKEQQSDLLSLHSYLGPAFNSANIEVVLKKHNVVYTKKSSEELISQVADLLKNKYVIGWFSGKMEFGPRALGNRSILANPAYEDMQKHVNLKIKKREGFRPFAPIVLEEFAQDWFDMPTSSKSMLYTYPCKQASKIPSCVHVDKSSRVQSVNKEDNPKIHELLVEFNKISGYPVLINTSFNIRGEPIVCSPQDAIKCFFNTDMDALVLEDFLLLKEQQPESIKNILKTSYDLD